jgi:hypothetical protein
MSNIKITITNLDGVTIKIDADENTTIKELKKNTLKRKRY